MISDKEVAEGLMQWIDELREEAATLSRKSHPDPETEGGIAGGTYEWYRCKLRKVENRIEWLLPFYWKFKGII